MSPPMFPPAEPFERGLLKASGGHDVFWQQCGNPHGKPLLVVHGGPGSGAAAWWTTFPDPERYRIIMVDQRGCGRSKPHAGDTRAALVNNTTADLIGDFEALREQLGIEQWLLFGGSWGSTLSLAYAVELPERVSELVLWAVVTTRQRDIEWLSQTMGDIYPVEYDALLAALPGETRDGNVPLAFNRLLLNDDPSVCDSAARAWCAWEDRLATLSGPVQPSPRFQDPRFRLGFARLVTHYFGNYAFLPDDGITGRLDRITHIPAVLLRGRLDIASPLRAAYEVADRLPKATLHIVEGEAHGGSDETDRLLVDALAAFANS